jgi:hypothetical protein
MYIYYIPWKMGSCYTVPNIWMEYKPQRPHCVLCYENVYESASPYVKCEVCHIRLHTPCMFSYRDTFEPGAGSLPCPYCQNEDCLFVHR